MRGRGGGRKVVSTRNTMIYSTEKKENKETKMGEGVIHVNTEQGTSTRKSSGWGLRNQRI